MSTTIEETEKWERLADELRNFHEVARFLRLPRATFPASRGSTLLA
jgi:hypothetical protein